MPKVDHQPGGGTRIGYLPSKEINQQTNSKEEKKKNTHPVVTPQPLSLSTLMSNSTSPVCSSHSTRHQFRLPMMNFCFLGCPVGSLAKIGCCNVSGKMRAVTRGKQKKKKMVRHTIISSVSIECNVLWTLVANEDTKPNTAFGL